MDNREKQLHFTWRDSVDAGAAYGGKSVGHLRTIDAGKIDTNKIDADTIDAGSRGPDPSQRTHQRRMDAA
jgi:hypothetical protein